MKGNHLHPIEGTTVNYLVTFESALQLGLIAQSSTSILVPFKD